MPALTPDECRALGTLIEKAMTTPAQYPLTLHALVAGIEQKSNRDPTVEIGEDAALRAVDGLCAKGLARNVHVAGSRVEKYRHVAGEALGLRPMELAILAELLLRGPQTVGELRGRASRMHPLASLEVAEQVLRGLASAAEGPEATALRPALVEEIAPAPGSRAPRWTQLLCEGLHPGPAAAGERDPAAFGDAGRGTRVSEGRTEDLGAERIAALEARVAGLERAVAELRGSLGLP